MDKLLETIKKNNMLSEFDSVIAAVSGGADSVALLHLLMGLKQELSLRIRAVHINHGLRGAESAADEDFVRMLCIGLETELDVINVDAMGESKRLGISVEDAGRRLRYAAFEDLRRHYGYEKIAVAHNKNDNAETVLMWILRGTGLRGLCGIPAVRGCIIRPLLGTSRAEIEDYCVKNNLEYRTDASNLETVYQRNKLRLKLIPLLSGEYNPNIIDTLDRMSGILRKDNDCLDKLAEEAYARCCAEVSDWDAAACRRRLDIDNLKICYEAVAIRVIRNAIQSLGVRPSDMYMAHYESIYKLIYKPTGKRISLPRGLYAAVEYNKLLIGLVCGKPQKVEIRRVLAPEVPEYIKEFGITAILTTRPDFFNSFDFSDYVCTKEFSYDKIYQNIEKAIEIRNRRPGDKIYVAGMGGNKKIKDYFNGIKLSAEMRDFVPLVACGLDIIWIIDKKNITSDRYKAEEGCVKAYIHILRKNPDKMKGAED